MSPHDTPDWSANGAPPMGSGGFAINDSEFHAFRRLILEQAGITLNDSKKQLVASRLARRLRALGLRTYREYFEQVTQGDPDGSEMREMLNCITTNKTDFFREQHHFDFLKSKVFPEIQERSKRGGPRQLRIWSAGCSSGEEPYTLAMTILSGFGNLAGWHFEILATDLDTQVLARAQQGVYPTELLHPVPAELRQKYFQRGSDANAGMARVKSELRDLVTFRRFNLIEKPWRIKGPFDLIFCRNVLIYFDRETVRTVVESFAERLSEAGYLFLGHSESLQSQMDLFEPLRGTIYRLRSAVERAVGSAAPSPAVKPLPVPEATAEAAPVRPVARVRLLSGSRRALAEASGRPSGRPLAAVSAPNASRVARISVTIGGVRASADPVELRTVLGSCVCACLYDPVARIGGINHFMLPDGLADAELPTRYGVNAMEMLINDIAKLGGDRRRLEAKAFGAAHVLVSVGLSPEVPRKNAQFIRDFLEKENIRLVSSRLGGSAPVEVLFHATTGRALVRALGANAAAGLAREETHFDLEIRKQLVAPRQGDVVLFDEAA
jgi:chemotaxis protein methyltransferase CheR